MKKEINTHQICIIIVMSVLALKLLSLPSYIYGVAKTDGFISVLIIMLFDFLVLFIILYFKNKYKDLSFSDICERNFGKILTKILFFLIFLMFFLKMLMLMWESYTYFRETIFKDASFWLFATIFFITVSSMVLFGLNSFARTSEFIFYVVFVGLIVSSCIIVFSGRLNSIFPIFKEGATNTFRASFDFIVWFGDYFFLFLFMDKIKVNKESKKRILLYVVISMIFVVVFIAIFYSVYTVTSLSHKDAITDIVRYAKKNSTIDSLDWIPIFTMMFLIVLQGGIFAFSLRETYAQSIHDVNVRRFLLILIILLVAINFTFINNIEILYNVFIKYFKYVFLFTFYVCPLLLYCTDKIKYRGKYEKTFK